MKLANTPSVPIQLATPNWFFNTSPIGDAKLVTNEIIPNNRIITMIANTLLFCFFVSIRDFRLVD